MLRGNTRSVARLWTLRFSPDNVNRYERLRTVLPDGRFGVNPGVGEFATHNRLLPPLIGPVVIEGFHVAPGVIYPVTICSTVRSFDGRFLYDYELPRVVAFTATAATKFETIRKEWSMGLILLIVLVVLLLGGLPRWEYSRNWGYGPSGGLGLVLVIVLILLLLGYLPRGF
jgi:Protein of unknown function (DUF3309)